MKRRDMRGASEEEEDNWRRLEEIRRKIDETDDEIAYLLSKRMRLALSAREVKKALKIPISDASREKEVIEKWVLRARNSELISELGADKCRIGEIYEEMFERIGAEIVKYTLRMEEEMDCVEQNHDDDNDNNDNERG